MTTQQTQLPPLLYPAAASGVMETATSVQPLPAVASATHLQRLAAWGEHSGVSVARSTPPTVSYPASLSRPALLHWLRYISFVYRLYTRRFRRLLRPYLLTLVRSRAVARIGTLLFPPLKRYLYTLSHIIVVSASSMIIVRRYGIKGAESAHAAVDTGVGMQQQQRSGVLHMISNLLQSFLQHCLARWQASRVTHRWLGLISSLAILFVLFTCYQIIREYQRQRQRRARRLQRFMAEQQAAMVAAGGDAAGIMVGGLPPSSALTADQLQALYDRMPDDTPDASPSPSLSPTPMLSPATSHSDLQAIEHIGTAQQQRRSHAPALSTSATTHHQPTYSFHRDCTACIAAAIATHASTATAYTHNHPPTGADQPVEPLPASIGDAASGTDTEAMDEQSSLQQQPPPHLLTTLSPSAFSRHPLVWSIARRMEWSPGAAASASPSLFIAHVAPPGSPLRVSPSSAALSASFVSPASLRLTNIKLTRMRRLEEAVERIRMPLQEHMRREGGGREGEEEEQRQQQQQYQQQQQQHGESTDSAFAVRRHITVRRGSHRQSHSSQQLLSPLPSFMAAVASSPASPLPPPPPSSILSPLPTAPSPTHANPSFHTHTAHSPF